MRLAAWVGAIALGAATVGGAAAATPPVAVAPQYDTVHVYLDPAAFTPFVTSLLATFGGHATPQVVATVTPTPSRTLSQLVMTPVGWVSVFGFLTPVPPPFGRERTGYLVTDLDTAVDAARANGAEVLVPPFPDKIGRDAIVRFPGGVATQLYWHSKAPHAPALRHVPENRVYLAPADADAFVRSFLGFAHGRVVSDDARAPGAEIGLPGATYRRIRLESAFGKVAVLATDAHPPAPYGREVAGYEVTDLGATLARATAAGATVLVPPVAAGGRRSAVVQFPGGYVAEIHAAAK